MKANELMIGDWVNLSKGNWSENRKVELIDIEMIAESVYLADPIPLTSEILEKNGFECRGAWCLPGEDLGLRQDGDSWGLLSYYAEYDALAFCHVKYVHELQHALRLCGIEKEIEL